MISNCTAQQPSTPLFLAFLKKKPSTQGLIKIKVLLKMLLIEIILGLEVTTNRIMVKSPVYKVFL